MILLILAIYKKIILTMSLFCMQLIASITMILAMTEGVQIAIIAACSSAFLSLCGVVISLINSRKIEVVKKYVDGLNTEAIHKSYKEGVTDNVLGIVNEKMVIPKGKDIDSVNPKK